MIKRGSWVRGYEHMISAVEKCSSVPETWDSYSFCTVDVNGSCCLLELPQDCRSLPCQNGGACVNDGDSFICNCTVGFKGRQCELCKFMCFLSTQMHRVDSVKLEQCLANEQMFWVVTHLTKAVIVDSFIWTPEPNLMAIHPIVIKPMNDYHHHIHSHQPCLWGSLSADKMPTSWNKRPIYCNYTTLLSVPLTSIIYVILSASHLFNLCPEVIHVHSDRCTCVHVSWKMSAH